MSFESLFTPLERVDEWIGSAFDGAPPAVALILAVVLGLRHASDPDHLVGVTSLIAGEEGGPHVASATRLGAWWGLGHALTLVAIGIPLIALKAELPAWLEAAAERAVGAIVVVLAGRVLWKWLRGDYRASAHAHSAGEEAELHRHLHSGSHSHAAASSPRRALAIGFVHGLAGSGAVVLLLLAALPTRLEASIALVVFAPMSIASMAGLTAAFAWLCTRRAVEPLFRRVAIPALGVFGVGFGVWYATG